MNILLFMAGKPVPIRLVQHSAGQGRHRHWIQNLLLAVALFFGPAFDTHSATYYVDNTATGAKNGTSWANAWTNVNMVAGVNPGDTIYISGGTSGSSHTYTLLFGDYQQWMPTANGAFNNPITYAVGQDPAHNGTVIFSGAGKTTNPNQFMYGNPNWTTIDGNVSNANHIVFQDCLPGNGFPDGSTPNGFAYLPGTIGLHLSHIDFHAFNFDIAGGTNLTVEYCTFWITNQDHAIIGGTNFLSFHNNTMYLTRDATVPSGYGDDGVAWGGDNSEFYSNIVIGVAITNYIAGQHQDGWQVWGSNLRVHDNLFFNLGNSATFIAPPSGTDYGISNVWIYNNVVEQCYEDLGVGNNNSGTFRQWHNIVVANNDVIDGGMFFFMDDSQNQWNPDCLLANNIYWTPKFHTFSGQISTNLTFVNNVAIQTDPTADFIAYKQAANYLINPAQYDFHLTSAATAFIGTGTNLSVFFKTDKDGKSRPSTGAWDLGAYQFSTNVIPPALPAPPSGLLVVPH